VNSPEIDRLSMITGVRIYTSPHISIDKVIKIKEFGATYFNYIRWPQQKGMLSDRPTSIIINPGMALKITDILDDYPIG